MEPTSLNPLAHWPVIVQVSFVCGGSDVRSQSSLSQLNFVASRSLYSVYPWPSGKLGIGTSKGRHIWSRFAVRYHPPPPTWYGPKTCVLQHSAWKRCICSVFAWWVAGAVRNPANSLDFCNQPSENVLFAMFRLRHRGVVPPRPLLFLCQIIIKF